VRHQPTGHACAPAKGPTCRPRCRVVRG
jgi:hypothetical protein